MIMSEEVLEPECESDSTEEDVINCNSVEYEQELYSIVNFSNHVEEENVNHTDFQLFYSTSKKNKVSRLQGVNKILQQVNSVEPHFVAKTTDFSKESIKDFIPLCDSTSNKQSAANNRQKFNSGKRSLRGFRDNFAENMVKSYGKRYLGIRTREREIDNIPIEGRILHPIVDTEIIVLSDSDTGEATVDSNDDDDDDVVIINAGGVVLEVSHMNDESGNLNQESVVSENIVSPETSDICAKNSETSGLDDSVILCGDSDINKVDVSNECNESDVEILPTPIKPSPPVVFLEDSGDEIFTEENSEIVLANIDTNKSAMADKVEEGLPVVSSNVTLYSTNKNSAVANCWTPAMIKLYNESSGGEDFDHQTLQKAMSRSPKKWSVASEDDIPSTMSKRMRWLRCSNCNQRGHSILNCLDQLRIKVCSLCGQMNHNYTRCPNRMCSRCGVLCFGSSKSGCSACIGRDFQCNHCNSNEHITDLCPEVWRCYHHTTCAVLKNLHDHPAENLKSDQEQCCPNCGKWGHKYEDCDININWLSGPNQPHTFRTTQNSMNGWSKQRLPNWWNPPHSRNHFHNSPLVVGNRQNTTKQLRKLNRVTSPKDAKIAKMKKLLKKRKKREKLAAKQMALKNGVCVPAL